MNKKIILTFVAILAVLGIVYSAQTQNVYAQESGKYPPLIQKLIEKFNLNTEEVDAVMDEHRTEMETEHNLRMEEKLNTAVENGKITEEQKAKILAKFEEIQSRKSELLNLTQEERRTKMQELHDEMQSWAEETGIDLNLVMGFGRKMHGMWHMKGF